MSTREDGSLANSDEISQQRKSLMVAAIRRGQVKISEPILLGEAPSQRTVSAAVEQGHCVKSTQEDDGGQLHGIAISTDEPAAVYTPVEGLAVGRHLSSHPPSNGPREIASPANGPDSEGTTDQQPERKRSIFVECEMATPASASEDNKKVRRSSAFRTVLRRVFGRKEKRISKISSPTPSRVGEPRAGIKHEYTRSDPLPASTPKSPPMQSTRGVSTQNAIQALRNIELDDYASTSPAPSMLPFPMNVNAPEQSLPSAERRAANYTSFETRPRVHKRRATLPSMVISPEDGTTLHKMWSTTDLTPISASDNSGVNSHAMPSPTIGIALSSPRSAHPNRRSRSAGALHELARQQQQGSPRKRRSTELKYWRSSKIDSQQEIRQLSPELSPARGDRPVSIDEPETETSELLLDDGSSAHRQEDVLHSFDFSSVSSTISPEDRKDADIEAPLIQLDSNEDGASPMYENFATAATTPKEREFALKPAPRINTPRVVIAMPAISRSATADTANEQPVQSTVGQIRPTPSPSPSKISYPHSHLSSSSTAAASGSPQMQPPRPKIRHSTVMSEVVPTSATSTEEVITTATIHEHLAPLYNALRYERQTRKTLEMQVSQLRNEVVELNALVAQMRLSEQHRIHHTSNTVYVKSISHQNSENPSRQGSHAITPSGSPVKEYDGIAFSANGGESSRFSGYDSSDGEDAGGHIRTRDRGMVSPQELWATPMEEHSRHWGSSVEGEMF